MRIQPKNWETFQHYKHRSPPWIRLYRGLLDNYEYHCLPVASRALAPYIWLLASEYQDGIIDAPVNAIAFRFRMTVEELNDALTPLINGGFFVCNDDASTMLAERNQDATPEKRRVETETEKSREEKAIAATVKPSRPRAPKLSDDEWMNEIKINPAYAGIDIDRELGKCQAWCMTKNKPMSRPRILNWLNGAEKPFTGKAVYRNGLKTFEEIKMDNTKRAIEEFAGGENDRSGQAAICINDGRSIGSVPARLQ